MTLPTHAHAARLALLAAAAIALLAALVPTAGASVEERAKRNAAKYGGTPPMWVEHPYLAEVGDGRVAVRAQAYVDPFRRPTAVLAADLHRGDAIQLSPGGPRGAGGGAPAPPPLRGG